MNSSPATEIKVSQSGSVPVLEVRGRLTIGASSEELHKTLESTLKNGGHQVVINLNGVPQIDSSGIAALVRISNRLVREGGALHLVCTAGRVREALTVTRIVEAIPTFDSLPAAVAKFA